MGFDKNYSVENMLKTSFFKVYLLNMVKLNGHNDSFRRVKYSYFKTDFLHKSFKQLFIVFVIT